MPILTKPGTYWWISLILAALAACGCQSPTIPNPNDPDDVGLVSPDVLKTNLTCLDQFLAERVLKGEITRDQANSYMAQEGIKMVDHINIKDIPKGLTAEYADIFRVACDWKKAKEAYAIAVKDAKSKDKQLLYSLRFAVCAASLGEAKEAVQAARSAVGDKPTNPAECLIIIYNDLVPRARGQKVDKDLADLVILCVKKYKSVKIEANSDKDFARLATRAYHIQRALRVAYDLYSASGDLKKAQECLKIEIPQYLPKLPPGMSRKEFEEHFGGGHGNMMVPLVPPGSGDFRPGAPGMAMPTR